MTKKTKLLASVTIVIGILIMLVSLVSCGFNFKKLSGNDIQTSEYEITDAFENIHVLADTEDIKFLPSESGSVKVVCKNEEKRMSHSVAVNSGTLEIKPCDERKWYDRVDMFSFEESEIIVYLPVSEYGALKIEADTSDVEISKGFTFSNIDINLSTGDTDCRASATEFIKIGVSTGEVDVEDVTVGALDISASTGDIELKNVNAASISVKTNTGDLKASNLNVSGEINRECSTGESEFENVNCGSFSSKGTTGILTLVRFVAAGMMNIERSNGDVTLRESDAGEILIQTSTGDVNATLLTAKVFITNTSTGKIRVPESTTGEKCKIVTSTGDITASFVG